jgi:hypothetical protein
MGGKTPETCWAVNKRQDNKLKNIASGWWFIWIVRWCTDLQTLNFTFKFKETGRTYHYFRSIVSFFRMSLSAPHYEKNLNDLFMLFDLSSVDLWRLGKKPHKCVKKKSFQIFSKINFAYVFRNGSEQRHPSNAKAVRSRIRLYISLVR